MPITAQRIRNDIAAIARFTQTPGAGASRPTFSNSWRAARDYVASQLESIGCVVRIDAAGNLHARPAALAWDAPAWLSGSHIDSVPNGGDFDGVVGIVTALETLRAAKEDGDATLPLELVIWAEEEGTTFGLGMLGSRAYVGDLTAAQLAMLKNSEGKSYLEAGAPHGVRPEDIFTPSQRLNPNKVIGLIECHIEQGADLWKQNQSVAIVTAINGRRQYRVTLHGQANHAGSTRMADRADALAGAAKIISGLEAIAYQDYFKPFGVVTVGQLIVKPNAINVIPGEVTFTIDLRAPSDEHLLAGDGHIRQRVTSIAQERKLTWDFVETERTPAVPMERGLFARLQAASATPLPMTVSGALHDAAILAPHVPTAMLFVASRDGISHNPVEFSRIEDIVAAAQILLKTVKGPP